MSDSPSRVPTTSKYVRNADDDPAEQLERDLTEAENYIELVHGPLLHYFGTTAPDLLWEVLEDARKSREADMALLDKVFTWQTPNGEQRLTGRAMLSAAVQHEWLIETREANNV